MYDGASAAIVAFSVTSQESYGLIDDAHMKPCFELLTKHAPKHQAIIVLGTEGGSGMDSVRSITEEMGKALLSDHDQRIGFYEVNAKRNLGIDAALKMLATNLMLI